MGASLAAQSRGLPGERLAELAFGRALEDPGNLGQQVTPPARQRAELGHRGGFLAAAELTPPGPVPGLPRQLRDQDPVSLGPHIAHTF
jgi:hypothetical protein